MNPQFTSGEVVTAAKLNQLPKGVLGYAEVIANQAGIGTTITDLTGLSVAVTVVAGRRLRITGHVQFNIASGTNPVFAGYVREGTTQLGRFGRVTQASGTQIFSGAVIVAPTAGAHTYKLSADTTSGAIDLNAAATFPAYILVEDIGSST